MTFFYDLNQRLANIDKPKTQILTESTVAEKIEPPIKTNPAEKGKHSGKTIDQLKSQMAAVKKSMAGYRERGEKVPDKLRGDFSELTFAIRAKQAHGGKWDKIKEDDMEEGNYFTGQLAKARAAGKKAADLDGDGDMEKIREAAKPDYIDLDKDGNRKESMKKAAADKKKQSMDEGWDDMLAAVDKRREKKVGDVERGHKHDIEHTATGRKVTRRTDDQGISVGADDDQPPTGEKRKAGRPKKTDKKPERVTAKAYKHKHGRMEEGMDDDMTTTGYEAGERGEYDREGDMAKEQLHTIEQAAQELKSILSDEENLPEWVQSKITKAMDYVDTARDYMLSQHDDRMNERELTGSERQEKERVFKKHMKPQMASFKKRYGKEEGEGVAHAVATNIAKGVKMGKKKEESVEETTTSGSVATSTAEPKGKKGMTFGKGIYDSVNREVENLIAESMSINASMNMDQHGGPSKSLTVTATDEDAEKLAALLMMAGLGGQGGCPTCGAASCGCDQQMDEAYGDTNASENKPDWPTAQEGSDDALQYSGGLNKPKVTGQTTVPVTSVQPAQSPLMYEDNALARMMEMAGIPKSELEPYRHTMKEQDIEEGSADSVVKKEPTGFSATAPAGKRLSVSMSGKPLKPSDVKVVNKEKDMDENLIVTPAPRSGSTTTSQPAKPAPAPKPAPAGGQTMGTIKGGVWTADPPKKGEKGVPVPVPVDEKVQHNLMRELAYFKSKK